MQATYATAIPGILFACWRCLFTLPYVNDNQYMLLIPGASLVIYKLNKLSCDLHRYFLSYWVHQVCLTQIDIISWTLKKWLLASKDSPSQILPQLCEMLIIHINYVTSKFEVLIYLLYTFLLWYVDSKIITERCSHYLRFNSTFHFGKKITEI